MARSGKARARKLVNQDTWIDALRILSADVAAPILYELEVVTKLTHEPVRDIARRSYERVLNGAASIYEISLEPERLADIFSELLDCVSREVGEATAEKIQAFVDMLIASDVGDDDMPSSLAYTSLLYSSPSPRD